MLARHTLASLFYAVLCFSTVWAFRDREGKLISHPLIGGKLVQVNRTLHPLPNSVLRSFGLPINAPRSLPKREKARSPTPREMAPRQLQSAPPLPDSGHIIAKDASGGVTLCAIAQELSVFSTFTCTEDLTQAATFTITSTNGLINIAVAGESAPQFGGVPGASQNDQLAVIEPGSPDSVFLLPVQVSSESSPNTNNAYGFPSESNIWEINPITAEISLFWTGSSGSFSLTLFHDVTFGDIEATPNLPGFMNTYGDQTQEVRFFFTLLA